MSGNVVELARPQLISRGERSFPIPDNGLMGAVRPRTSRYESALLLVAKDLGIWGLRDATTTLSNGRSIMPDLTSNWTTREGEMYEFDAHPGELVTRKFVEKMREAMQIPGLYHVWVGDMLEEDLKAMLVERGWLKKNENIVGTLTDEYHYVPIDVDDKTLIAMMRDALKNVIDAHARMGDMKYIKDDKFLYVTGAIDEKPLR